MAVNDNVILDVVNINEYPQLDEKHSAELFSQFTIGDLHGNSMKLLHLIIRQGIADLSEITFENKTYSKKEVYEKIATIYSTPAAKVTAGDIQFFKLAIDNLKILSTHPTLRLIGDETADRGANDYYVLKILAALHKGKVNVEIDFSNHGAEFVEAYETFADRQRILRPTMLNDTFVRSLNGLSTFLKNGLVSEDELFDLIDNAYKPMLKLLSYSIDEEKQAMTMYTHAATSIDIIKTLATKFKVSYQDNSLENLVKTIDKINHAFSQVVKANKVHTIYTEQNMRIGYGSEYGPLKSDEAPVEFLIWNRDYSNLNRPKEFNNFHLTFVHGHDSGEETHENIININGRLGVNQHFNTHTFELLYSNETCAHMLQNRKPVAKDSKVFGSTFHVLSRIAAPLTTEYLTYDDLDMNHDNEVKNEKEQAAVELEPAALAPVKATPMSHVEATNYTMEVACRVM